VPSPTPPPLRHALTWAHWAPSLRAGLWVLALFVAAVAATRVYAGPIERVLAGHALLGASVFIATSALAVLMPALTNLPLVPLATLAWGPWWTAALLLAGWTLGSALSFLLGREARALIVAHFPAVHRHAQIDQLIHPRHRMACLVLLRMTFPVDVLSYALGLFSPSTTLAQNTLATLLGAAPFALLFSLVPVMSLMLQLAVFGGGALLFGAYTWWALGQAPGAAADA
jgi:uncharacterized membrane protein YdjX (TVP38/TMEM64 family)